MTQEDKIKAYLLNQLPPEETVSFKAEIQENPELQAKVKGMALLLRMKQALEQEHLKTQMGNWSKELPPSTTPVSAGNNYRLWLLAGFILCTGVLWWASQHFSAPQLPKTTQGSGTNPTQDTVKIDTVRQPIATQPIAAQHPSASSPSFYNTRDEIKAELQRMNQGEKMSGFSTSGIDGYLLRMDFKKVIAVGEERQEKSDETKLKIAFSYLQLKQYKKSIVVCDEVLQNPNVFFFNQNNARWIKAQCLYALRDYPAATKELEAIKNAKSPRGNSPGQALLDKVEKLDTLISKIKI